MQLQYTIRNTHRAIGTKISSRIVRKYGMTGLQPGHLTVRLRGSAGQSLGAFAVQGLKLEVFGDANDYVGKGLSGATIVVRPGPSSTLVEPAEHDHRQHRALRRHRRASCSPPARPASASPCATRAPTAVVEGCGSNGCEYMTGGTVVVLGGSATISAPA